MQTTTTRSPWTVLVSTSLAIFAVFLDTTILFVAFPAIRADFSGVSASSLSWVLNAYAVVFAALLVPAGRLADHFGRRRFLLVGVAVFTGASAICAVAPGLGVLVGLLHRLRSRDGVRLGDRAELLEAADHATSRRLGFFFGIGL